MKFFCTFSCKHIRKLVNMLIFFITIDKICEKKKKGSKNMANILDYIEWRGDLDFKKSEFNEIDSLILSRFSYFPLEGLLKKDKKITIKEAYERFLEKSEANCKILQAEDLQLFPAMANSIRFGNLYITDFINKIDKKEEKQFCAVTILLPNNVMYVSYRGTDNTLVGCC